MNRRTPRRRISPRALRRYRAIKNFVRRALGSSSQPDIKTNSSSISVSVLDLKQKIDGIEQQLNTVSKHCQDLVTLEPRFKLNGALNLEKNFDADSIKSKVTRAEIFNKTSQDRCHKVVSNRTTPKEIGRDHGVEMKKFNETLSQNSSYQFIENRKNKLCDRLDTIQENEQTLHRRRKHMASKTLPANLSMYASYSFDEPRIYTPRQETDYLEVRGERNRKRIECLQKNNGLMKLNNHKKHDQTNKYLRSELDQDFIADIIRRQYRPIKLLGRRESDFSQFSAPVCRDQEFPIRVTVQEGSDLCSCCHEQHKQNKHSKYMCNNDLSDMRSICDTRLYSSKKHKHHTNDRKRETNLYNDSAMYDVIPVKEKSSPKSRRKFVEDNMIFQEHHREVPPSPRTQRPRLNLRAKYYSENDEDDVSLEQQLRHMRRLQRKSLQNNEGNVSSISSEVFIHNRNYKGFQNRENPNYPKQYNEECVGTGSNLQTPILVPEQTVVNNDTTLNTQTTDASTDKTDKTLSEIKVILQSFLQEIKKESSQSDKLNNLPQPETLQSINETQQQMKSNHFNNNNFGSCSLPPYVQSFPNSCCYPMLPVCPINCMQNGFGLPTPSFTCAACANNVKQQSCGSNELKNNINNSENASFETQKLIKEIHNLILQNPNSIQKKEFRDKNKLSPTNKTEQMKTLTSRSVGGSSKASKHDAKVGTTKLKCHSKSCEAIGSRETTNTRYATNVSYSDTVLEKGSGDETTTETASESEDSEQLTFMNKKRGNKFTKMLRSMGIFKRNKADVIEELTESDSSTDVAKLRQTSNFQSHPTSPFQQHIINYNMHGQEYFHPPLSPNHPHQYDYCGHTAHYDHRTCYSPTNLENKVKNSQGKHQDVRHCTSPRHMPIPTCAKYYEPHFINASPQVPVCLKEIEVKSIGTQSVRKMSLLEKLTNKIQVPVQQGKESPAQSSTRTSSKDKNWINKPQPALFDWKKIHEKAMQKTTDPLKFSFNTQKKLAEGDNTMRNAMLKKLFYKRNPFSPRNLLVRTLLGKDRSSFGEPPKMYKPKMFL